ncbi:MAG: hypothetical protein IKB55_02965 [Clostridia bacterium]|nr:hypothetical protein [Clostridia bacterium]
MKKLTKTLSIGMALTMAIGISASAACPITEALKGGNLSSLKDYINCNKGICIGTNISGSSIQELLDKLGIKNETEEKPEIEESVPETEESTPQAPTNASAFEKRVLELVNIERAKYGLSALQWSNELASVARAHSKDMNDRGFFSHTNPDGKSAFDRIKAAGISYSYAAENIAAGQSTPEAVVEGWMNSKGHRENILNPNLKYLGVGFYEGNGTYKYYWTQNFTG